MIKSLDDLHDTTYLKKKEWTIVSFFAECSVRQWYKETIEKLKSFYLLVVSQFYM